MYAKFERSYKSHMAIFRSNLFRFNGLLIILYISMFFLSGLVSRGTYFTFYSSGCFFVASVVYWIRTGTHLG